MESASSLVNFGEGGGSLLRELNFRLFAFFRCSRVVQMKATIEIIDKPELAKRLQVSTRQVELLVNAGVINQLKLGGRAIRFDFHEVIDSIKAHPDVAKALRDKREELEKKK